MKATTFSFEAIGTGWQIEIVDHIDETRGAYLLEKILERIGAFDKAYSRFRPDSLVMQMAENPGTYTLPMDAEILFSHYRDMYGVTGGRVTPLIGDVLADAGYDATYSLVQSRELQVPLVWEEVIEYQYPKLLMKEKAILDFGAGGKGYLIDIIANLLEREGISHFTIDAGGDILARNDSNTPLVIGLEDPNDSSKVIGTVSLVNQSIAGSAGNRRVWGKFHHIIDPLTLSSPGHILRLWVIAESTILADLLATALFFTDPECLAERFRFEFLILYPDYSIIKSEGFNVSLFSEVERV